MNQKCSGVFVLLRTCRKAYEQDHVRTEEYPEIGATYQARPQALFAFKILPIDPPTEKAMGAGAVT